jgi:hypothetical protein
VACIIIVRLMIFFFELIILYSPDHSGLDQTGEILNFWVHHWILCIVPFHLILSNHFQLDKRDHYYYKLAICIGGLVHFDLMGITSIITGHNVGYMLYPPPSNDLIIIFILIITNIGNFIKNRDHSDGNLV